MDKIKHTVVTSSDRGNGASGVNINNTEFQSVRGFRHLGSPLTSENLISNEIQNKFAK